MPQSTTRSALVLAGYSLLGLGLSLLVLYRRDLSVEVEGSRRLGRRAARRAGPSGKPRAQPRREGLPRATNWGPAWARLVRAHLFQVGRTALVRIGAMVSVLSPLALWGIGRAMEASGFEQQLFGPAPKGVPPLGFAVGLLMVGPLATVIGLLAVGNELSLGMRRALLSRGVSRLQAIVAQSLALLLVLAAVLAVATLATWIAGGSVAGNWAVAPAARTVLVGLLSASAYLAAVQLGGALAGSGLGAMAFGFALLAADWLAVLAPSAIVAAPPVLSSLARYSIVSCAFSLAGAWPAVPCTA
jgi:hypothetical protein